MQRMSPHAGRAASSGARPPLRAITLSALCALSVLALLPGVYAQKEKAAQKSRAVKELERLSADPALKAGILDDKARVSISKLRAYIDARKRLDAAYQRAVDEAKKAGTPAPPKPLAVEHKTDWYQAHLQRLYERAYPHDMYDASAILRAIAHREKMPKAQLLRQTGSGGGARTTAAPAAATPGVTVRPGIGAGGLQASVAGAWESVGPRATVINQEVFYGPAGSTISGRINGVAFSHTDPNVIFVAASTGGLWKTTDGGLNWSPIGDALWPMQDNSTVAIDPFNSNNILVGLGDADAGPQLGRGFMRSTDGGQTWTNVYDPGYMGGSGISAIVYDPDTPGLVLAASRQYFGSIMRSTNGGASWTRITAIPPLGASYTWGDWSDLEVSLPNPSAPGGRYYYAAAFTPFGLTFFDAGGLYRSSNDGLTWTRIPLPGEGGNLWSLYGSGFKLATSAVDPNILYVARAADQVIYRGIRNPATDTYSWTEISGPNGAAGSFKRSQNWGQTTYNFAMLCIPQTVNGTTKDALYLSLLSFNGALGVNELSWTPNWVDIGKAYVSGSRTHADNHAIAYSPANPNIIGIGNDGGFYRVTYNPALSASPTEATWQFTYGLNNALVTTQFYQSDFHPTNPNFLLGGTQDNANIYSHGDLTSWRILNGGDGSGSAINPVNPLTQYACNNFLNVNMTRDAWATSRSIAPNYGGDNVPLNGYVGIDPTAPNPLYVGTDYLWRYNPLAGTWNPRLGGQRMALTTTASNGSTSVGIVRCIEVAPQNPNIIYTGTTNGNLWVSFNYGANWKQLASGSYNATDGLPNRAITDIDINPANPNDIIVTLSGTGGGHVYQCANTSAATPTFTNRSGSGGTGLPDAPFESFARDFNAPQTRWYAGSDIGVFMTTDGGATWSDASGPLGMPYVEVSTLKAVPGTGYLMAGTYGRGIWRLPLVDPLPQDNSPANVVLSANAQLVAYNSQSYFYDVHFVMNNTGGTDAQGGAVTTARLNLNGTNYTPQSPTVLPLTFGTIPEGAGAVRRTMRFIVPRQDGVTRTATLFANGQYTANGTVTPFQFSNRITLSPL